jgi:hypothetical protein
MAVERILMTNVLFRAKCGVWGSNPAQDVAIMAKPAMAWCQFGECYHAAVIEYEQSRRPIVHI